MHVLRGLRLWIVCSLGFAGCGYVEAQLARTAAPDDRIQLGRQDRLLLRRGDVEKYTCVPGYLLQCERFASFTYSCTCSLR